MKRFNLPLLPAFAGILAASSLAGINQASAATASTVPLGYVTYTALGQSDTFISLPVHRKEAFIGKVNALSPASDVITVQGGPGWVADQFVYAPVTQTDTYYVLITTGDSAGRYFEVTANGADTLTIANGGEDLTTDVVLDTGLKLIPFWTLNTLMAGGDGIHFSTSHSATQRKSEVIIPNMTDAGIDLASSVSYYYYNNTFGAGPGWRQAGGGTSNLKNDDTLAPDSFFIVRHNVSTGGKQPENDGRTEITPMGTVFNTSFRTPLSVITTGTDQDNAVAITVPVDLTLAASNLWESGAFEGSTSHSATQRKDQVLVFDNTVVGKNKASALSYYYYDNTFGAGPGWRQAGGGTSNIKDADVVFSLEKTVIIRKKGIAAGSVIWDMTPSYVPF